MNATNETAEYIAKPGVVRQAEQLALMLIEKDRLLLTLTKTTLLFCDRVEAAGMSQLIKADEGLAKWHAYHKAEEAKRRKQKKSK